MNGFANHAPQHHDPDSWIRMIFSAQAAKGGVVRRSIAWVDREVGRARFIAEVRDRGFRLLATSTQFIVVFNREPIQVVFWTLRIFVENPKIRVFVENSPLYPFPTCRAARILAKSSPA